MLNAEMALYLLGKQREVEEDGWGMKTGCLLFTE